MEDDEGVGIFIEAARRAGAEVAGPLGVSEAVAYIAERAGGSLLLPPFASGVRLGLAEKLRRAGCAVAEDDLRGAAPGAAAGVTGTNFAIADTGTLVLESTAEAIRLATTLPERHFALLDPRKIVPDGLAAVPHLRDMHRNGPRNYLAYITGPSRTADIERVLTIGVHGPRELHILLVEGLSGVFLEM
ncbi:lactate utilization protein [uncultured Desulfuromonas sp.]|uniref:LutC/YkgG family protein n=1 Tax=uncultured Desulfuromonas sp. TaxID=181013 RepID=UPI002637D9BC|nr:lactate utilization protein [uncultured Desulfuromonas sp.]